MKGRTDFDHNVQFAKLTKGQCMFSGKGVNLFAFNDILQVKLMQHVIIIYIKVFEMF